MGDEKENLCWSIIKSFINCLLGLNDGNADASNAAVSPSGPEAAMVAAAKHFSSAHKVQFS